MCIRDSICWTKHDTDNRKRAFETTRDFLHRLKISRTLVHKWLKIRSEFSPTLRGFFIVLPTRCTQKPNPTKRCQTGGNALHWCEPNKVAPRTECKCKAAGNASLIATLSSSVFKTMYFGFLYDAFLIFTDLETKVSVCVCGTYSWEVSSLRNWHRSRVRRSSHQGVVKRITSKRLKLRQN